jgi:hypothetical protein
MNPGHGHGNKISRQQEQTIAALLSHGTIKAAAARCGISESTLRRWMRLANFKAAYESARANILTRVSGELQNGALEAVLLLKEIARDANSPVPSRVTAARCVLEFALQLDQFHTMQARLAQLEAARAQEQQVPPREALAGMIAELFRRDRAFREATETAIRKVETEHEKATVV